MLNDEKWVNPIEGVMILAPTILIWPIAGNKLHNNFKSL